MIFQKMCKEMYVRGWFIQYLKDVHVCLCTTFDLEYRQRIKAVFVGSVLHRLSYVGGTINPRHSTSRWAAAIVFAQRCLRRDRRSNCRKICKASS